MPELHMTSLTLDAIACKEEEAVVVDYIMRASSSSSPSSTNNDPQYPIDIKYGFDELCPVCGDKVSGYHYGLLTCESCKGFFKRTVQNKKVYSCVDNRNCHIDKSQRKRCPYCRFQKCLQVGMKLEAVRSDRMRGGRNKFGPMYKRDRALKQQAIRQQQQLLASCQMRLSNGMTPVPMAIEDVKPNAAMLVSNGSMDYGLPPSPHVPHSAQSAMTPPSPDNHMMSAYHHITVTSGNSPTAGAMYGLPHHYTGVNHLMCPSPSPPGPALMPVTHTIPPLIKELQNSMVDEQQVRHKMASFIQHEFDELHVTQNPESLMRILCQLSDQCLFLMVEWARNSVFFKELKVEDQMKLLQHCWSELVLLDFVYRQVKEFWQDEFVLASGHHIPCSYFDKIGLGDVRERLLDLIKKMRDLKIDYHEYICLKFLVLLNPDVSGVEGHGFVEQCQEKVNASLLEYCMNFHPQFKDKFGQVLLRLPEIRLISIRMEEYLFYKHMSGEIPEQTLLMEMLHSKRK